MGPLVDRFGAWIVTGAGSALWGLATVVLPLASLPASLFSIRLLFGLGHSMLIAATAASVSREFGSKERARAIAFVYSGNQVGLAAGATFAAFILVRSGWQAVFYWMGGGSLLLSAAWFFFYPDRRIGARTSQPNRLFAGVPGWTFFVTDPPGASLSASWDISTLWAYL